MFKWSDLRHAVKTNVIKKRVLVQCINFLAKNILAIPQLILFFKHFGNTFIDIKKVSLIKYQ